MKNRDVKFSRSNGNVRNQDLFEENHKIHPLKDSHKDRPNPSTHISEDKAGRSNPRPV